jgi:hypothetical protein
MIVFDKYEKSQHRDRMGRKAVPSAERKNKILFARVATPTALAFRRYCEDVHARNPSAVLRLLVEQTLFNAGCFPTRRINRQTKKKQR